MSTRGNYESQPEPSKQHFGQAADKEHTFRAVSLHKRYAGAALKAKIIVIVIFDHPDRLLL
jgi:hypothetical protein